jgi:hypothetical protein
MSCPHFADVSRFPTQFIVMFRARFGEVFPKSLPHYGPQDIEKGVADSAPGDHVERLLCALVGLVLNRKKDVEYDSPFAAAYSFHVTGPALKFLPGLIEILRVGRDIINALSKKLFKLIHLSGRDHGGGKTPCPAGKPSRL